MYYNNMNFRHLIDLYHSDETGTEKIMGLVLVTTTEDSILTLRNPSGNASALTITPLAGGTRPVSAHLVIIVLHQHPNDN